MYRCNPTDYAKQIEENKENLSLDEFISWFDGGGDAEGAYRKAESIFNRLILPVAKKNLRDLNTKDALDIGYGNAGLAVCASNTFNHTYAIDWHDSQDMIGPILEKKKHGNLALIHSPEGLNIRDDSIDFLYSWLFVQRLGTIEGLRSFLHECYRVMRDHGVGVLFFPRYIRSGKAQSVKEYEADVIAENEDRVGYREGGPNTKIRGISIVISLWKMKELLKEAGFTVIGQTASYDGKGKSKIYHGQHGLIFRKGDAEPKETKKVEEATSKSPVKKKKAKLKKRSR